MLVPLFTYFHLFVDDGAGLQQRTHFKSVFVGIPVNLTRDQISAVTVHQVKPGAITVGEETITENVVLFRDIIQRGIALGKVEALREQDLDELLSEQPEIVIFGTGWKSQRPRRDLVFAMARRGIGFETMDTPAACRTFNILVSEGRDVAAILIIRPPANCRNDS
jgi:uncharacterized protein